MPEFSVQRKVAKHPASTQPLAIRASVPNVLRSPGESLDSRTRAAMESSFGHDFSRVRIHSDDNAARSARSIDALAYTVGRHVVFGDGQYAPGTVTGKRLLAHELAHVVQQHQPAGPAGDNGPETGGGRDALEQEAGAAASLISAGKPAHLVAGGSGPLLQRRRAGADNKSTPPERQLIPSWTPAQLGYIQAQLKRLGLYRGRVDRRFGQDTEAGLVEAFASDDWRKLNPAEIIRRLRAALPSAGKPGEHNLRYGELFKDGLLDITLGIGYDESGWGKTVYDEIRKELPKEGFEENATKAKEIYRRTGHMAGPSVYGMYFVWKNELTYSPPAATERKIAVVVRLVSNPDERHGAETAAAFEEGMKQSDVAFYAGHGRFGSGPDFDRALKVTFFNPDGTTRIEIDDYEKVEGELINEVKSRDVAVLWRRFQWMIAHNMVKVEGENRGNIYLNPTDRHPGEFAARLMYWNLNRRGASTLSPATGRKGELARPASERSYRLWVFNGCRTHDYEQSIRSTPGADPKSTDIIATRRTIYWSNYVRTIIAFMQGILAHQSAEQIIKEMDATQLTDRPKGKAGVADVPLGLEDNPVFR